MYNLFQNGCQPAKCAVLKKLSQQVNLGSFQCGNIFAECYLNVYGFEVKEA